MVIFWAISQKEFLLSAFRLLICGNDIISYFDVVTNLPIYR